jgi:thymidylate kinase
MAYRVLFAGIDGSGKSSCVDLLMSRLRTKYSIIKLGDPNPCLHFQGKRIMLVNDNLHESVKKLRQISIKYHFYALFMVSKFIYKFILEKYVVLFNKSDLIFYPTDKLLHPTVYFTYLLPSTKKIASEFWFLISKSLFGFNENYTVFYLDAEPDVAMERICKRGSPLQPHENVRDLATLRNQFAEMIEIALRNGFEIIRINTNVKSLEEVTDEVQSIIEKKLYSRT